MANLKSAALILLVTSVSVRAEDCVALGNAIARAIFESYSSSDARTKSDATFCSQDINRASAQEAQNIAGSYAGVGLAAGASRATVTETQRKVCDSKFGASYLASQNALRSSQMNSAGEEVMKACLQQDAVAIVNAAFSFPYVKFTVRNGTTHEVVLRKWTASQGLVESCSVSNQTKGKLFDSISPAASVEVDCTLKSRPVPGEPKQVAFGGGFLGLDLPMTTFRGLPVPKVIEGDKATLVSELRTQITRLESDNRRLATEKETQFSRLQQEASDKETILRRLYVEQLGGVLNRTYIFTMALPDAVRLPPSKRFRRLDLDIGCSDNWDSSALKTYADKICRGDGFALGADVMDASLQRLSGGSCLGSVGAFVCKLPAP